jgi:hypothetical protein
MRHWPAVRAHARQAARRSSPEQTVPAIAGSRTARTGKARQPGLPGLPGTPRRPQARTGHMSHSSPATCRSAAWSMSPQPHDIDYSSRLTTHHVKSAFPARPPIAASGHDPAAPSASPLSLIRSARSPTRYRPRPGERPRSTTARNTTRRPGRPDRAPISPSERPSSSRHGRAVPGGS